MKTLIINATNATDDPSIFEYVFPASATFTEKSQIAISSVNLFYSWFNITSELQNNTFQYIFPTSAGSITRTIVVPDGFYTLSGLNLFLQQKFIEYGDYAKDATGTNIYFLQITENQTAYAVQIDLLPVPTSTTATSLGYTQSPSGGYPTTSRTPQFVVLNNDFQVYSGLNQGTYPTSPSTSAFSVLSQNTPEVSYVNSVLMSSNLVNNPLSVPSNIIYAFTPNASFGSIISPSITELVWNQVQAGSYDKLRIQFLNELYRPIKLRDTSVIIQLIIREVR